MPVTLDASDRKLLLVLGAAVAVLLLALALVGPSEEQGPGYPSSYSARSEGAKAAFLLLKEAGYRVERWESSPADLPSDPSGVVLLLAEPRVDADKNNRIRLQKFVAAGGRILAVGFGGSMLVPEGAAMFSDPTKSGWTTCQPRLPSALTRGGDITMQANYHWSARNPSHLVHYARGDDAVVVSYSFGKGEIIWWGGATPLTNAGIREPGNLELLLNSIGAPEHTRVLWDEYFHGARPGPWEAVSHTPLRWALLQLGLFFAAVVLTFSRRSGPVRTLVQPSRLSPLEFVETLGGLYQSAGAAQVAVEISYQRFQYLLAKRLGLPGRPAAAEMARAARQRLAYDKTGFAETLAACQDAIHNPDLRDRQALALVQALNDYSRDLELIPRFFQEKN